MAEKIYIVEGRQFKTDADRKKALHDQEIIEGLREKMKKKDLKVLYNIRKDIENGDIRFLTVLGDDFIDELDDAILKLERASKSGTSGTKNSGVRKSDKLVEDRQSAGRLSEDRQSAGRLSEDRQSAGRLSEDRQSAGRLHEDRRNFGSADNESYSSKGVRKGAGSRQKHPATDEAIEREARLILKRKERRRKLILIACATIAVCSIGFVTVNSIIDYKKSMTNQVLSNLRQQANQNGANGNGAGGSSGIGGAANSNDSGGSGDSNGEVVINYTGAQEIPDVLPEFQEMLAVNSNLIGWLTIDGTNIDYPVAQTVDNEYYLSHDLNQNYDRNGTIFLDVNCDVIKPSTNLILYGHHMQSGNMFGKLDKYESKEYYEGHKYITFDSLYEYGTYQVMYVFRSHVYSETEIAFKYYQFYEAYSEVEFDSYMQEMAEMSLYDTGVTASYGDRLLTLSTCDYQEKNGRFVVVAKKIK